MKPFIAFILCLVVPMTTFASSADSGYKVSYDGGSVSGLKTGTDLHLFIDKNTIRLIEGSGKKETPIASVPTNSVTEISYGQDVHRRVGAAIGLAMVSFGLGAIMLFAKSKKHFVGLTWANGDEKGGLVMQCDKNEYRGILAGLEGVTGKKAVDSAGMTVKN